jgi:hypothetical protein
MMLIVILVLVSAGYIFSTNAELIDRGGGLIYDTDLDITWLKDANYANTSNYEGANHINGQMQWEDAKIWAGSLVYQGYNDWRLPKMEINGSPCTGIDCMETEALHLFNNEGISYSTPGVFINVKTNYWSQTESSDDPDLIKTFSLSSEGNYGNTNKTSYAYAWAVRDGDSEPNSDEEDSNTDENTNEGNILGCFVSSILPEFLTIP